ncbi:serine/threonine-protein kinase [Oceanithermus sp.]
MGLPGKRLLERYSIVRPIAHGAVATVYLAFDDGGSPYAVKVFPRGFAARADREWRVGHTLKHEHVNPVLERFDIDEYPAVLMKYAPGSRLSDMPRLAPGRFLNIFSQLLSALAHLHEKGFVHRDVKPENLIVDESDDARLIDFDLSGPQDEPVHKLRLGTIAYIAPELVRGKGITPASDLYAAGVILYWGLTGELPYVGDPRAVMNSHLHDPLPAREGIVAGSPLSSFLERLTAKDPANRFQNAAEALARFEQIMDS